MQIDTDDKLAMLPENVAMQIAWRIGQMTCRIGMTTDVTHRVERLKATRHVPCHATLTILSEQMTYESALRMEAELRTQCGFRCEGADGAPRVGGYVWTVYRLDW